MRQALVLLTLSLLSFVLLWRNTVQPIISLRSEGDIIVAETLDPAVVGEAATGTGTDAQGVEGVDGRGGLSHTSFPSKSSAKPAPQEPPTVPRTATDAGVDLTDAELYATVDLGGDSSTATVMGMGTGYSLEVYERWIGSLRKSGFRGHILMLVGADDLLPEVQRYFQYRNVTWRTVELLDPSQCANQARGKGLISDISNEACVKAYPELKARWARYPLLRDFLRDCDACTGPVLYIDVRDAFFQSDPFGEGSPPVTGLQVYHEDVNHRTTHWFVADPLRQCKGVEFDEPNLCSGSTVGTRAAMLRYLDAMYEELKVWTTIPNCTFSDQPLHNYMVYSGQLPFASPVENWAGTGIVLTVDRLARQIVERHTERIVGELHLPREGNYLLKWRYKAYQYPFEGADPDGGPRWLGRQFDLVDDAGFFTERDGTRARAVHKYDRFGGPNSFFYKNWWSKQTWFRDPVPQELQLSAEKDAPAASQRKTRTVR